MLHEPTRKAIERLYTGKCDIYEYQQTVDPINKRTTQTELLVYENQPCRVSFSTIDSVDDVSNVPIKKSVVKLFIAPELNIKAGCKIKVIQHGIVKWYEASGEPAYYASHQEIVLILVDKKA